MKSALIKAHVEHEFISKWPSSLLWDQWLRAIVQLFSTKFVFISILGIAAKKNWCINSSRTDCIASLPMKILDQWRDVKTGGISAVVKKQTVMPWYHSPTRIKLSWRLWKTKLMSHFQRWVQWMSPSGMKIPGLVEERLSVSRISLPEI